MTIVSALTIAGSDSGGGAGIQADLKAFSSRSVYGASVITALTAQNTQNVTMVEAVSSEMIAAQIKAVLDDIDISAIKIGMLGSADVIRLVAHALAHYKGPIILDPVMVAKSGDRLLATDAEEALIEFLVPRAWLLTPNLPEAACLVKAKQAETIDDMRQQANARIERGARAVLMKGGHSSAAVCHDLLVQDGREVSFTAPRLKTRNTHGTGCSLSSAIAAEIAKGKTMVDAVQISHQWLQGALKKADSLNIGNGYGPVHHFHEFWS